MTDDQNPGSGALNVSRETSERLEILADLLKKWNPRINLVSKSTLTHLWLRHIQDSTQLFHLATPAVDHWLDIGSGGGFPGLVIALMAAEPGAPGKVTLIESDQRKCTFLRTVLRETGITAQVLDARIERAAPQDAQILSARALAELDMLLGFAERHLSATGTALFPKGVTWKKEVAKARESWSFELETITSITEPNSVVLKVKEIRRV